jgi:hypothetical protein
MSVLTNDDHLRFDITFALSKCRLPGFRRPWHALSELDQRTIVQDVIEHLKRCRWQFARPENQLGPSPMSRREPPSEG